MATQSDEQRTWTIPLELRLKLLAALAAKPSECATMTYEEFLEWADEDTRAEWVEGEIIMPSPANIRHQRIAQLLSATMMIFVQQRKLGEVFIAPFQMKLAHSGREPDVLFLANDHLDRLTATLLNGPADLVIEVISPDSIGRDRGDKFYEYQEADIPEYWLIDPLTERAEFYQLDAAGKYQLIPPDDIGVYRSKVMPEFWLRVEWLWREPLPTAGSVLRQLGISI